MVLVSCPLKQDDIIKLIEEYRVNDEKLFSLKSKKGVQLYFDSKINNDEACGIIKNIIKSYKYGPALMYNVVTCDGDKINWYK
ncbi:Uncharacterised protein [uncultured Clostridium sp.]|uniref:hypothetical protein n=1 Tax=uncultured Clostridium sp. TaxID=59620 RepID=UPI000822C58A|nr:hypothetical protein [uncultured Clostridium sp.]SCJ71240.1 Uncharacterised protein [uncultured Clostridium sp.]